MKTKRERCEQLTPDLLESVVAELREIRLKTFLLVSKKREELRAPVEEYEEGERGETFEQFLHRLECNPEDDRPVIDLLGAGVVDGEPDKPWVRVLREPTTKWPGAAFFSFAAANHAAKRSRAIEQDLRADAVFLVQTSRRTAELLASRSRELLGGVAAPVDIILRSVRKEGRPKDVTHADRCRAEPMDIRQLSDAVPQLPAEPDLVRVFLVALKTALNRRGERDAVFLLRCPRCKAALRLLGPDDRATSSVCLHSVRQGKISTKICKGEVLVGRDERGFWWCDITGYVDSRIARGELPESQGGLKGAGELGAWLPYSRKFWSHPLNEEQWSLVATELGLMGAVSNQRLPWTSTVLEAGGCKMFWAT